MAETLRVFSWLLAAYSILNADLVNTQNPGLQIRILQSGLNRAATIALAQAGERLKNEGINNIETSSGSQTYWIKDMAVSSFINPRSRVVVDDTTGVTWIGDDGQIRVNGNWRYRYRKWGVTIVSDSGSFTATVSNVDFRISARLSKDSNNRIHIRSTGCTCTMNKPSIDISGTFFSFLYDYILSWSSGRLRNSFQSSICKNVREAINADINKELSELQLMSNLNGGRIVLDYSLLESPVFGNGYLQTKHKGEIRSVRNPVPYSAAPGLFPVPNSAVPRMVYVWGSDYLINSFAYTVFHQNRIHKDLTVQDMDNTLKNYARTSCSDSACFGYLFPNVAQVYPNRGININLTATSVPIVRTTPQEIKVTISGELSITTRGNSNQQVSLLRLRLTMTTLMDLTLTNNIVRCRAGAFRLCITDVLQSSIGRLPVNEFNNFLDIIGRQYIIPKINALGNRGIEVLYVKGSRLVRSILKKYNGGVMYAADVDFATANVPFEPPPIPSSQQLPQCAPFTQTTTPTSQMQFSTVPTILSTKQATTLTSTTEAQNQFTGTSSGNILGTKDVMNARTMVVIIGAGVGTTVLLIIAFVALVFWCKCRRKRKVKPNQPTIPKQLPSIKTIDAKTIKNNLYSEIDKIMEKSLKEKLPSSDKPPMK